MKKKYLYIDKQRRCLRDTFELYYIVLKMFFLNKKLPYKFRFYVYFLLTRLNREIYLARLTKRCLLTGRANGVFARFGFSRLMIRREGTLGYIPGLRKHSW